MNGITAVQTGSGWDVDDIVPSPSGVALPDIIVNRENISNGGESDAMDEANYRAQILRDNYGGARILVTPGTYTLTRSMPLIEEGIQWDSYADVPAGEIGIAATLGTRLIAATPGAYDCFTDGRVDTPGPRTGVPNVYANAGIRGFLMDGFRYGVKMGAINQFSMFRGFVQLCTAINCTEWGFSLENFFHTEIDRLRTDDCINGGIAIVGSGGNYNPGNSRIWGLNVNGHPAHHKSRTVVFMNRTQTGVLNDLVVSHTVGVTGTGTLLTMPAVPVGVGQSGIALSPADAAKLYVDMPVYVGSTVNGLTANRVYFVYSINTTTGVIELTDGPESGRVGGDISLKTMTGTTAFNLLTNGAPRLEILGYGGGTIQPSTFDSLNLEGGGTCSLLVSRVDRCQIRPQLWKDAYGPTELVLRNAMVDVWSNSSGCRADFDSTSRRAHRHGIWKSSTSSGGQGGSTLGMIHIVEPASSSMPAETNTMRLSLNGSADVLFSPQRGTGIGIKGMLQLWHSQAASGSNLGGATMQTYTTGADGTLTIPASSDTANPFNVGEVMRVSNPTSFNATISAADGLQFIGSGVAASSYVLPARSNVWLTLHKGPSNVLHWAVG